MTTYLKKLPALVGILFFGVASSVAVLYGANVTTALLRGFMAAAVAVVFAALLGYILFHEKIPEAEVPKELEGLAGKLEKPGK
jgi:purine-cytosine permease-like protein